MKKIQIILLIVIVVGLGLIFTQKFWVDNLVDFILKLEQKGENAEESDGDFGSDPNYTEPGYSDLIRVEKPKEGQSISSPLVVEGVARGQWYFEATFPIILVDWDGKIVAESYAEAQSDWMTENFVPYKGVINFESPYKKGDPDFMKRGVIILQKSNPSGLPQNDAATEIPVVFN